MHSIHPVNIPDANIPQSPVCPKIVEIFIAKKNPTRIEVKFIISEITNGTFFRINSAVNYDINRINKKEKSPDKSGL